VLDAAEWAGALAGSPWALAVLYAATAIDGFFPPVPSESVVIALAALPLPSGRPTTWLLVAVAALGAFTGDQVAYSIGRRAALRPLRNPRSERTQRAVAWAEASLANRGAAFLIGARFVPGGRVAANLAAGALQFSRRRFTAIAALAAVLWSTYAVLLGLGTAHLLAEHHPVVGVTVGVVGGLFVGAAVDRVLRRRTRARRRRAGAGRPPGLPASPEPVTTAAAPSGHGAPEDDGA
jgi:membrane-associated protein